MVEVRLDPDPGIVSEGAAIASSVDMQPPRYTISWRKPTFSDPGRNSRKVPKPSLRAFITSSMNELRISGRQAAKCPCPAIPSVTAIQIMGPHARNTL
jgi:hypothetical protein